MGSEQERRGDADTGRGQPPDGVLARRAQVGDRAAFELLVRRYLHAVHAVAASFLRERADVEDVAQETFLRALQSIRDFNPARPFAPWLYQIARNVARNRLKWQRRHPSESLAAEETSLADSRPSPATGAERSELRATLERAVEELPDRRRTVFRLVDMEGYTAQETGALMGLTSGAVRAHLHHARRALRARLEPLLNSEEHGHDQEA